MLCRVHRERVEALPVAALVLAYNGAGTLPTTLEALAKSIIHVSSLLVVDNASDDGSQAVASSWPGARLHQRMTNDGYGVAMNEGAALVRERNPAYLLFLTQECILAPDALARMVAVLERRDDLVAVGPLLLLAGRPDTVWSSGGELRGRRLAARHDTTVREEVQVATWLDGAALLVRAEEFYSAGGFRSDFFLYWEDVELCLRLRAGGLACACVTTAHAWQDTSLTPPYLATRNRVLYLRQTSWLGLAAALGEVLARAAVALASGRRRRARLVLTGATDALRGRMRREVALERPR
jgi:N-acetylglucosaminyl-diphospho-decaprenol L-rhamnosyltransferase